MTLHCSSKPAYRAANRNDTARVQVAEKELKEECPMEEEAGAMSERNAAHARARHARQSAKVRMRRLVSVIHG